MNEQLVVKNFGPITDATVDFKRVTVFIGPTGGGKSTLAKLAAVHKRNGFKGGDSIAKTMFIKEVALENYFRNESQINWATTKDSFATRHDLTQFGSRVVAGEIILDLDNEIDFPAITKTSKGIGLASQLQEFINKSVKDLNGAGEFPIGFYEKIASMARLALKAGDKAVYFPSNRTLVSSVEYSWPGFLRDDIGLPKDVLDFANDFSLSRKDIPELDIVFLNVKYLHRNGQDFIKVPGVETLFRLYETASGIQSVTPLLVLLEHLNRNTEQAQSFIIEEPELNLFPTAQFELVKILVDKCARIEGKNDLVLTTHSPYVLTALNLLCYAHRIAQQDEATAKKVAKLIPRHCWIDPNQFAAYYVDRPGTKRKQQVRSIINKKTGLIEENELDTASDELSSIFDKLVRLRKPTNAPAK